MRKPIVIMLAAGGLWTGAAQAQLKYLDENGQTHYVQNENLVPEKYRGKAKPINQPTSLEGNGSATRAGDSKAEREFRARRVAASQQRARQACLRKIDPSLIEGAAAGRKMGMPDSENVLAQLLDKERRACN